MTQENDPHHLRLSTVETRQKTLENQFTSFTSRYEKDRQKDEETTQLLFSKLNGIANELSGMEGSRGRVPIGILIGVPGVVVPIVVLLGVYFMLHISPLQESVDQLRKKQSKQSDAQLNLRVEQARDQEWQRLHEKYFTHPEQHTTHE